AGDRWPRAALRPRLSLPQSFEGRFMKTLLCAGALALALTASAAAKPGTAVTTVNLRAEANTTSEILGKIQGGSRLDVGDCTGGWCAVTWAGKSGFAIATALDL